MSVRDRGVDAARGLAMVLMTATHALRIFHCDVTPEFGQWLLRIEPVTPMLFFIIAGWSLARSLRLTSDVPAWRKRHLLRALALWAISACLFFVYSGPQWPEILLSNGVLGCLAVSIAIAALLGKGRIAGVSLLVVSVASWLALDLHHVRIDGINNGTFPLLPYFPVFLSAFLVERLLRWKPWTHEVLATTGAFWVLVLSLRPGFRQLWGDWGVTNTFQDYFQTAKHQINGFALSTDLFQGLPPIPRRVGFWAPLPALVPVAVALAGLCIQFFSALAARFPSRLRPLSLLGRHSLPYYVGHLALLGTIGWILPPQCDNAPWTWLAASIAVIGAGMGYAAWREPRGAMQ
jgi:hypothetical protein